MAEAYREAATRAAIQPPAVAQDIKLELGRRAAGVWMVGEMMRELTSKEVAASRKAYKEFLVEAWVKNTSLTREGFYGGFTAGLDHQQTTIDKLLAYIRGELPMSEIEELLK